MIRLDLDKYPNIILNEALYPVIPFIGASCNSKEKSTAKPQMQPSFFDGAGRRLPIQSQKNNNICKQGSTLGSSCQLSSRKSKLLGKTMNAIEILKNTFWFCIVFVCNLDLMKFY